MTEQTEEAASAARLLNLTSEIIASYVANNSVRPDDLAALINSVHLTVAGLSKSGVTPSEVEPPTPAVPVKKSVNDAFLVCLEDGMKFKSIKRHLATNHGLSPEEYRAKWGLPRDYPMVAPEYAKARSALAKQSGLGSSAASRAKRASNAATKAPAKGRGRPRKA